MLEVLSDLVAELRLAGLPVSLSEHLDAARSLENASLEDREGLKFVLGATLVKSGSHWSTFETVFEIYFTRRSLSPGLRGEAMGDADGPLSSTGAVSPRTGKALTRGGDASDSSGDLLATLLLRVLLGGDGSIVGSAAGLAVDRHASIEQGRPVGGAYYLYRTLHRLDLDALVERELVRARHDRRMSALQERLLLDEYRARVAALRRAIEAEIRRRLVTDRGPSALAKAVRRPLLEDTDVMHASPEELMALRRALVPLGRKIAVRIGRRRRSLRVGSLDVRSTIRHSLSTGGTPLEPHFRRRRPSRPQIFILADISGSVASFARFTLYLVYAIATQFSKVRSFVFVDGIDEITDVLDQRRSAGVAVQTIAGGADVVWKDGHSDYGHALGEFERRWGTDVTSQSTVLLLGDARNNYHASGAWVLDALSRRARRLVWLNPEPMRYWGSGDSIVDEYAPFCDDVVECRTLRQLERFVTQII